MNDQARLALYDALETNVLSSPKERLAAYDALENNQEDVNNLLRAIQFNTLGKQTSFDEIDTRESTKDLDNFEYDAGADSSLRALLSFGESDKDQEAILSKIVGEDGFIRDSGGRLALTEKGQLARGLDPIGKNLVIEDEGFSFGDIADLTGLIPETVGAIGGAILGLPGGLLTSAAGAAGGAALGQSLEEGVESLLGVQKQSASEVASDVITEAALAGTFELAGGIVFKVGRALIGGSRRAFDKAGSLQQIKDENLVRSEKLLDEGFIPSAERLGAPGMVAYQQKFAENVLRDGTRIETNLEAALFKVKELNKKLNKGQSSAATEGFENLSKSEFSRLKANQTTASQASMKAVKDSIDYMQKAVKSDATINEQLLKSIDDSFTTFEKGIARDFGAVDEILRSVEIPGVGNAQIAQVVPTSGIRDQFETLIREAGGIPSTAPKTQEALEALKGLGDAASFRQVVLLRKQINDAFYSENALFRRELAGEIQGLTRTLDDAVDGTNLSNLPSLNKLSPKQKSKLEEASALRLDVMERYKQGRQLFEDLDAFGVIRTLRNYGPNSKKGKFEIDRFFDRVIKADSPERLKQLFKTLGNEEAKNLQGQLSRTYLEKGIKKTGLNKYGDLTNGKFSGNAFNAHIQKLGDTGKILFGKQWDEVQNLGEVIARAGTDKIDNEIVDQIVQRATNQNKPLVQALKEVAEAKEAIAKTQDIKLIRDFNSGTLDPIDAVQRLATPKKVSLNEAKKIMDFFKKDPKALEDIKTYVVEDILSRVDGDVFSSAQAAQQLLKHLNSFDDNVLRTILGDDSVTALKEFAKDLEFLSDIGKEGNIAAASYTANPIKKYADIIKFKIFNKIGSNPEVAKRYVEMQKAARGRTEANGVKIENRVANTVEDAANKVVNTLDNIARVGRQSLAQAVDRPKEQYRSENLNPINTNTKVTSPNIGNIISPSVASSVGNIDITQPGVGDALGLSPTDQAIAGRQIRGSLNQGRITP